MKSNSYDVIIVGGGPAGLSAALVLGRCRRKVLVLDAGHPRNERSKAMHGYLSRDGISPAEFLSVCRQQLDTYPCVELRDIEVTSVECEQAGFEVKLRDGSCLQSRKVLLATGIMDELPNIPGLTNFYGRTVHHCPYCDGWEHRDQPITVHGCKKQAVDLVLELRLWTRNLVLCSDGCPEFSEVEREQLARFQIPLNQKRIVALEGEGDQLRGLRFEDGTFHPCQAMFFSPGQRQRSSLAEKLGCKFSEDGGIDCGENAATCVAGLYAAGNASRGLQLVIIAAAEGTQAAFAINQALLEEDLAKEA